MTWTRDRFMERVTERPDGCWDWRGHHIRTGYAVVSLPREGRKHAPKMTAHRLAYELFVGPVDPDLDADHLCFNRGCVNPAHVEPVTHKENIRRMPGLFGQRARATHCQRGHDLSMTATFDKGDGRRRCRTCRQEAQRRRAA